MSALETAVEAAERWAIHDPDPHMRSAIDRLVDARDPELIELFGGRLAFGTAGLRAGVGPGPRRMNALVVRQTTVGVVQVLQASGIAVPRVVVGFDARRDSADFARHAAAAVTGSGGEAMLADRALPTPVVAHAVRADGADAGIVITASHNPPDDNGYKLYLGDGRQIVDPWDAEIAAAIDDIATSWHRFGPVIDDVFAAAADHAAWADGSTWLAAHRRDAVETGRRFGTGRRFTTAAPHHPPQIVYTAMHGVGGAPLLAAFDAAGLAAPVLVDRQFSPDPDFPTVGFPNPEEPGALDEALAVAERVGADAIFAHDPDADRLAIAVRSRSGGELVALSGDQLGVLLGDHVLRNSDGPRLVARSVVSSRLLDAVAGAHGVECEVTLTGFKWIARAADTHPDLEWLFGYEEAIGYAIGDHVLDKDGITAALVAHAALAELSAAGRTVWDRFDELALAHGVYVSLPVTVRFDEDPARVHQIVDRLVESPPTTLGASATTVGPIGGGALPPTPGIELVADDRTRVIVRPSGTEPKVKAYVEVIEQVMPGETLAAARAEANARLDVVCAEIEALLTA